MYLADLYHANWAIWQVPDGRGFCPISAFLDNPPEPQAAKQLNNLLYRTITQGPPLGNKPKCKHLKNGIYEFKASPKSGQVVRIAWFYSSASNSIICTHWFYKGSKSHYEKNIKHAESIRDQYVEDVSDGNVHISECSVTAEVIPDDGTI